MSETGPARAGAVSIVFLGALLFAAPSFGQSLPATAPTSPTAPTPQTAGTTGATRTSPPRHRAVVTITDGRLEVRADNSSLNQILRDISQETGMSITGGVVDQRVFGNYGPGPAPEVLSQLLEDTGTNMILRMTPAGGLAELTLSPRLGGPTLPSPNLVHEEAEDAAAPSAGTQSPPPQFPAPPTPAVRPAPQPIVPPLPFSTPPPQPPATDPMQTPVTPDPGGIVSPPTVAPATEPGTTPGPATQSTGTSGDSGSDSTAPASPNGVKTPQQIYEELQKLRQQQAQPPSQ